MTWKKIKKRVSSFYQLLISNNSRGGHGWKNLVIAFLAFICLALSIKNISCVYHSKELFIEKNSLPENQVPKIIHSQEMMDEFIFGFIHSENRKVELPGSKPDYAIKIATKQKNIWWLENFIWINQDQIITSNNNDLEKNEGTLYKKGTGIYHTINSILSEGGL